MYFIYSDRKRAVVIAHTILLYRVLYNVPIYPIYLLVGSSEEVYIDFQFPLFFQTPTLFSFVAPISTLETPGRSSAFVVCFLPSVSARLTRPMTPSPRSDQKFSGRPMRAVVKHIQPAAWYPPSSVSGDGSASRDWFTVTVVVIADVTARPIAVAICRKRSANEHQARGCVDRDVRG